MGGTRAPGAWEEPGFSTGTDAQRRLPVFAGLIDWQAEQIRELVSAGGKRGDTVASPGCQMASGSENATALTVWETGFSPG
jgi:hypothetical protein